MDRSLIESRDAYFREDATNRHPVVDPSYAVPGDQFGSTVYSKARVGAPHAAPVELGDEAFFRGWRRYLETNAGHSVDTQSLRLAFEAESGESLEGFFTQWLMRAGYPRLQVHWDWLDDRKMARVTVEQTQPSDSLTPVFRFRLPLRFALDGAGSARASTSTVATPRPTSRCLAPALRRDQRRSVRAVRRRLPIGAVREPGGPAARGAARREPHRGGAIPRRQVGIARGA